MSVEINDYLIDAKDIHCELSYNWQDLENMSMQSRHGLVRTYQAVAGFFSVWHGHLSTREGRVSVVAERYTRDGSDVLGGPGLELVCGVRTMGAGGSLCPVETHTNI